MKTSLSLSAALLLTAVSCLPAWAEQSVASAADATSASAAVDLGRPIAPEPTVFDHVVYLARLPTPAELLKGAKTLGTSISRMDQTSDRLIVVYEYSGGRTATFAYTLLSAAANYPAPVAQSDLAPARGAAPRVVYAEPVPLSQAVYTQTETVYYTPRYVRYYDPAWDFWGPVALGFGIGIWGGNGYGHGGHGGWHGGHGVYGGHGGHH